MRALLTAAVLGTALIAARPALAQGHSSQPHGHGSGTESGVAALRSDLRSVLMLQERFRSRNGRYGANAGAIEFVPTRGVNVQISAAGPRGYSAVASQAGEECAIFAGNARSPRPYATVPLKVSCKPVARR